MRRSLSLILLLLAVSPLPIHSLLTRNDFPTDFIFGVATAAYQIEGAYDEDGRGMSIWDTFSHTPGKTHNGDTGDVADDHYHRVSEDIEILKGMGVRHYRMSLSWSRIMPNGTYPINQAGVDHYNAEIDSLIAAGITPYVTLYHWDLPQALDDSMGGWLNESIVSYFSDYAEFCFKR
jgi:beta-glucosidase/6-phospho-beta-glucosidase/beta-galactosidase